ncbi:MAG: triose-phosphate isomerase [Bacteroidota bacterium]
MRKKIAAGNWKMNLDLQEAQKLVSEVLHMSQDEYQGEGLVMFGPSFPFLPSVVHLTKDHPKVMVAAQNMHHEPKGAYTGEISGAMLNSVGVSHVILGHSERRQYFGEDNALLAAKIDQAFSYGLEVVYCFGETLDHREAGKTLEVVRSQVEEGTFHVSGADYGQVILAYEPVWAIGTGKTATPAQAQEVHSYVRGLLTEKYGAEIADNTTILYGGSVKPGNAAELFSQGDIDGGLIGGASLKSRDFVDILKAL